MANFTNDIGEVANPYTAHILISEFRKFIFLNQMNIKTLSDKQDMKPYLLYNDKKNYKGTDKAFKGLTAPPLIDIVWRCIIKYEKVYFDFCFNVLGVFLDRSEPYSSNSSVSTDYTRTLELLENYQSTLNPCFTLWPKISPTQLEYEYDNTY